MSTGMYEGAIQDLIDALGRLPGIGPKSAQRIAFHILQSDSEIAANLVEAVRTVKERVKFCTQCGNVSEETECRICRDPRRDGTKICVVEESKDVIAIERTREFRGKYHVLGGAISPIDGIGPDQEFSLINSIRHLAAMETKEKNWCKLHSGDKTECCAIVIC